MNRYLTQGIIEDLRAGKRVALLSPHGIDARTTFDSVMRELDDREVSHFSRAHGQQRVNHVSGGSFRLLSGPEQVDGLTRALNVLIVVDWNVWTDTARHRVQYAVQTTERLELIRL